MSMLYVSTSVLEGIDNPRLRGRKLVKFIEDDQHIKEGIDNPRLRGRKRSDPPALRVLRPKELIIPDSGDGNLTGNAITVSDRSGRN